MTKLKCTVKLFTAAIQSLTHNSDTYRDDVLFRGKLVALLTCIINFAFATSANDGLNVLAVTAIGTALLLVMILHQGCQLLMMFH